MSTQNVVITGANSGIGYHATIHFARTGANVVMACRNATKAEKAKTDILGLVPEANLSIIPLDVSDLSSVERFVQHYAKEMGPIDILINNAGIVAIPLERNKDGHELQLATNYLGGFALTGRLLPLFRTDTPARIVNVCSLAHRFGNVDPNDINWETTDYNEWKAYANSKLACMSFTLELQRRLAITHPNIIAVGAHPGFANTNINQNSPTLQRRLEDSDSNPVKKWLHSKMQTIVPTAEDAARPIILAATGENVQGGDYYGPGGFLEIGGKPAKAKINKKAFDTGMAKALWATSEKLTGVNFLAV